MKTETNKEIELTCRLQNELVKSFTELCQEVGRSADDVFDHWLEYILNGFTIVGGGIKNWPYEKEQGKLFFKVSQKWVSSMEEVIGCYDYYDFLGYIYENCAAGKFRRDHSGQFFTPQNICTLMAEITNIGNEQNEEVKHIYDPCCGSGRTILAGCAKNPKSIFQAQDIDRTCCLMTACNCLVHGLRGVVILGNSLLPDDLREIWHINPFLSKMQGMPHCVKFI